MKKAPAKIAMSALLASVLLVQGCGTGYKGRMVGKDAEKKAATLDDNAPVITNKYTEHSELHTVTIKADEGCTANVTVKDLNIDVSEKDYTPAVKTEGAGDVNIAAHNRAITGRARRPRRAVTATVRQQHCAFICICLST